MQVFALFFALQLIGYFSIHLTDASLLHTAALLPALVAGMFITAKPKWIRVQVNALRAIGAAVSVVIAYPVSLFSVIPFAWILSFVGDRLPERGSIGFDAGSVLGISLLIVPGWMMAVMLWLALRLIAGRWDKPILYWMLGSTFVCIVGSFLAASTPLLRERGGFFALAIPLTTSVWAGFIGLGLQRSVPR